MGLSDQLKKVFDSLRPYKKNTGDSIGISEAETMGYEYLTSAIYAITTQKKQLFNEYKDMAIFPEIADAIDEVIFDALSPDRDGNIISLKILDQNILENENITKNLLKEFNHVLHRVLDFNTNGDDLFRKFYVEGELFGEMRIDSKKPELGVLGLQYLPTYSIKVDYDDKQNPIKFTQDLSVLSLAFVDPSQQGKILNTTGGKNEIELLPSQVAYVNSGLIDYNKNLVYSYLERAKTVYRQLKWMENSLVIYRITRAPERRVFNIDVGKLPKNKADEYVKQVITRYKNRKIYNPSTGEIDVGKEVMAMTEDFYFPQSSDGRGSSVTTLPGGSNLSEISDIEYFLRKLYKGLKIPVSRMDATTTYNPGRSGEITRDEIKFAKYVNKIRIRFIDFIFQIYFTHLQLKGLWKEYKLAKHMFSLTFSENNSWKELKDLEMVKARLDIVKDLTDPTTILPRSYLYKTILNLGDEDIRQIKKDLKNEAIGKEEEKEREEKPKEKEEEKTKKTSKLIAGPKIEKEKIV